MKRIGLLSDTHGDLPASLPEFFREVDEIWHCGDLGKATVADELEKIRPLRAVHGNIDGQDVRARFPEFLLFNCEQVRVLMTHIGGYPGKYHPWARVFIEKERPGLFVCGHSHILKVIYDKHYELLHINPGAAGRFGMHHVITLVRFVVEGSDIRELDISEIPRNKKLHSP